MSGEQLALDVPEDREDRLWCGWLWCPAPATLYVDGGKLWWPSCVRHENAISGRLADHGTLEEPVKIRYARL